MSKKEKREALYYIVAAGLLLIAVFIDIYLISNGGGNVIDKVTLADNWTGSFFDWVGIVLFNATLISLAAGMFGFWELFESPNSSRYNLICFAVAAGSILMIYIV